MDNIEYDRCDSEVIDMTNRNHFCYPKREENRLMNEARAQAAMLKSTREKSPVPEVTREKLILQLCHGLIPVCIGMTWVLGAFEGLADPAFTAIVAGVCGLWGCVEWKWGKCRA